MFYDSDFYCDISSWDVHNVTDIEEIFNKSKMARKRSYKPKFNITESFDFGSVNKPRKTLNAYELLLPIISKLDNREILS